jgi:two-component system sensor histidine kinase HydH
MRDAGGGRVLEVTNRIAFRILVPLAVVSVLLLAIGAGAAWSVHRLQSSVTSRLSRDISSVQAAEELALTASQIEIFLDEFLLTGDATYLAVIPGLRPETEHSLAEAERLAANPEERDELAAMRVGLERFWREFADLRKNKDPADAASAARNLSSHVLTRQVRIPARDFLQSRERGVASASTLNESLPGKVAVGLLLLGVCGAVGGLLAGFGLARGISRSIAQLSVPIRDAAGTLSQVVGPIALSPTTDVQDLEVLMRTVAGEVATVVDRLEQSRRQVVRSEQLAALGQLAAGLAHELRNPLTSIKLLVQAAGENGSQVGLHGRSLAVVEEEIERLEHLVQSFLDFARPAKMQTQPLDLGPLVEQTIRLVGPRAALKSVAIETRLGDEPAILEADPGYIRQLLLNLLLNALDASEEGGRIVVEVARPSPDAGDGWAYVHVTDTGCGLPLDLGDRIFEPFVSTKETGLGLGLPICKQIVEAHGGTIEAAPRPGGGAVFTFRLPYGDGVEGSRGRGIELASSG